MATDISINYQGESESLANEESNDEEVNRSNLALADLNAILGDIEKATIDDACNLALPSIDVYYSDLVGADSESMGLESNSTSRIMFWYHPDYLGNVDLVTEKDGNAFEFFMYNPWGEQMHQWNANTYSFSSPYRFNGKELDAETGLRYYGARYYQNKLSVWLSVDPMAKKTLESYVFTGNNPIALVDPNGMEEEPIGSKWGTITIASDVMPDAGLGAGHAWIIVTDNQGNQTTFGTWGNKPKEFNVNLEKIFGNVPAASRTMEITEEQYNQLLEYNSDKENTDWNISRTCAGYASEAWEEITGEELKAKDWVGSDTPRKLAESIIEANGGDNHSAEIGIADPPVDESSSNSKSESGLSGSSSSTSSGSNSSGSSHAGSSNDSSNNRSTQMSSGAEPNGSSGSI